MGYVMTVGISGPNTSINDRIQDQLDRVRDTTEQQQEIAIRTRAFPIIAQFSAEPGLFPKDAYLAAHPDVAAAVQRGEVPSALHHYLTAGVFEGRPIADPARYLALNPDVAQAVAAGLTTAENHMLGSGLREGRAGLEGQSFR